MDTSTTPTGSGAGPTSEWVTPPPPRRRYPRGARLAAGSILTFLVTSLLFGPTNIMQALLFATICTAGIGLVFILVACYLIGWVVLEAWSAVSRPGPSAAPS
jgi:hypothetical protein